MKRVGIVLIILCLVSCSAARVSYDYDKATDFSAYSTYNYYPDLDSGLSELDDKRLLNAVDDLMEQKGIKFSEEPDFLINIKSRSFQAPRNNNVGVGVGGSGGNVGGGVSVGLPIGSANVEREIIFDFVDEEKDMLFWQAVSNSSYKENLNPDEREAKLRAIAEKVFEKYPPIMKIKKKN